MSQARPAYFSTRHKMSDGFFAVAGPGFEPGTSWL